MFNENANYKMSGHLRIYEEESGKILLDHHNAIHNENMSLALASSLAHKNDYIYEMVFGNGGVRVSASNEFIYSAPQIIGRSASLHNETYFKIVDEQSPNNLEPEKNNMSVSHIPGNVYTDIAVHCTLGRNEPSNQSVLNNEAEIATKEYEFSEIGLRTYNGDLITHICHYPIQKAQNITLKIDYILRLQMV